jgi:two-component system chemotaxis response regulator CheB
MPVMDGNQATQAIMERTPTPILVVTTVTQAEMVRRGLDILVDGALDIIQKPSSLSAQGFESIRAELIDKVKTLSRVKFVRPW